MMFAPGMLVVCIDNSLLYTTGGPSGLEKGRIYTIKNIYAHPCFEAAGGAVTLKETRPPDVAPPGFLFVGYRATRFRPARLSKIDSWTGTKVPEEVG